MSFRVSKQLLGVVLGLMLLVGVPTAWADVEQDRAEGIAWLLLNQNGDGSWGAGGAKVAATAEAMAALRNSGANKGFLYSRALSWLANARADSVDTLARKISALEAAGFDTEELGLVDELLALRNAQRGWGAFEGHGSGFPDTALALAAINSAGAAYPDLTASLDLIRNGQATGDSGWSYIAGAPLAGDPGLRQQIMPSAYNLMTLSVFQAQSDSSAHVTRGVNWLIDSVQQSNGSFLEDNTITTGSVHKTALGYLAIKSANDAGVIPPGSAAALANAQMFILGQQVTDGSWDQGAFATGLALRTLPAIVMADSDSDGIPDTVEPLIGTDSSVSDERSLLNSNGLDPDNLQSGSMSAQPIILELLIGRWFSHVPALNGETVTRNRGAFVSLFDTRDTALAWLNE